MFFLQRSALPQRGVLVIQGRSLTLPRQGLFKRGAQKISLLDMRLSGSRFLSAETWTRLWKRPSMLSAATIFGSRVSIVKDYPQLYYANGNCFISTAHYSEGPIKKEAMGMTFCFDGFHISDVTGIPLEGRDVMFQPTSSRIVHITQRDVETFSIPKRGEFAKFIFVIAVILISIGITAGIFTFSIVFQQQVGTMETLPLGLF